jgi:hypothetical protein
MTKEERAEWLYRYGIITLAEYLDRIETDYTIKDCQDFDPATLGF